MKINFAAIIRAVVAIAAPILAEKAASAIVKGAAKISQPKKER